MAKKNNRRERTPTVDNPAGDAALRDILTSPDEDGGRRSPTDKAAEQDEVEVLQRLRDEAGNGGYVRLYRRIDGTMEYASITRIEIAEYNQDNIQRTYGGGYYKVAFCTANNKTCGIRRLIIDPSIPFKNPAAPAPAMAQPPGLDVVGLANALKSVAPGGSGLGEIMPMFLAMMQTTQQQNAALLQAIMAKKEDGASTVLLEMLRIERDRKQTPASELLETFDVFRRITRQKGGDDDDEKPLDFWDKLGKVGGPIVQGLAEKYLGGGGGMPPGQAVQRRLPPQPGQGAEAAAATAAPNGEPASAAQPVEQPATDQTSMNPLMKLRINQIRQAAVAAAAQNADPAEFAAELISEVPSKYFDNLEAIAAAENWLEDLYADADPQVKAAALQSREWFGKMREALLAALKETEAP